MKRPLFLVGFMGSGKSAVGRLVAVELGLEFRDSDELIAGCSGKTVQRIFRDQGESAFRALESEVIGQLCSGRNLVAAAGGGAFLSFGSRRRMIASGTTVWLDTPLAMIRARLADDRSRPLWNEDDPAGMRMLYERRRPSYALAGYRVGGADPDVAVEQVVRIIRGG